MVNALLNGQNSSWKGITSGVLQGSILGPLLFLIYINDLSDGLPSNCKLFADDTSLFSVVYDVTISSSELNSDLAKISEWVFKWKISFNPDPTKPAQEVIFSKKLKTVPHPSVTFNNNPLSLCPAQNHLELLLDSKLTFNEHIKHILSKVNKSIGLLRNVVYYADVVYDQIYRSPFHEKPESIQHNAALAVTGAIRGSFSEKLYQELGLKSFQNRRWFRKLCQFYKILKSKSPRYLFNIIPTKLRVHNARYCDNIPLLKIKHNYFRNSFLPLQ